MLQGILRPAGCGTWDLPITTTAWLQSGLFKMSELVVRIWKIHCRDDSQLALVFVVCLLRLLPPLVAFGYFTFYALNSLIIRCPPFRRCLY
jgi:hypothetical protein